MCKLLNRVLTPGPGGSGDLLGQVTGALRNSPLGGMLGGAQGPDPRQDPRQDPRYDPRAAQQPYGQQPYGQPSGQEAPSPWAQPQGQPPVPYQQPDPRQAQQPYGQQQPGGDLLGTARDYLSRNAGGMGLGAIGGLLLGSKGGRNIAGTVVKVGGAAVLGTLAYAAYKNYRAGRSPMPTSIDDLVNTVTGRADTPAAPAGRQPQAPLEMPPPETPKEAEEHATVLLKAMVAAALADGHMDPTERGRIFTEIAKDGVDAEEQAFLANMLDAPASPEELARAATTPERAAEIYLASLLAIDADTDIERAYLSSLAFRLGIDEALQAHIAAQVQTVRG